MKKFNIFLLAMTLVLGASLSSCNKYEEGPSLSLASAKSRFAGDWTLSNITKNGVNQDISGITQFYSFSKSGSYNQTLTVQTFFGPATGTETGTWAFNNKKTFVVLTKSGETTSNSYELLELRKNQFKVRYTDNGDLYTRTFVAK